MRECHRHGDGQGDLEREPWRYYDDLVLRYIQYQPRRRGCRLYQRFHIGEGDAYRLDELHLPVVPEHLRDEAVGRHAQGDATRGRPHHRQREPAADQPRGMR